MGRGACPNGSPAVRRCSSRRSPSPRRRSPGGRWYSRTSRVAPVRRASHLRPQAQHVAHRAGSRREAQRCPPLSRTGFRTGLLRPKRTARDVYRIEIVSDMQEEETTRRSDFSLRAVTVERMQAK